MVIQVNGKEVAYEEGMTVKRLLEKMNYTFPMIIVRINGKLVLREDWDTFVIPRDAEVQALHQIAGG